MAIKRKIKICNQLFLFEIKEIKKCIACFRSFQDDKICSCGSKENPEIISEIFYNNQKSSKNSQEEWK